MARSASLPAAFSAPWTLPALGLALVALGAAQAVAQLDDATRVTVALVLTQGAIYAGAAALVLRGSSINLGWVVAVAALMRLELLFLPPYLSNDVYRYVWDGYVQGAGVNPYLYIPNDPALAALRDGSIWPNVNRGDYAPTIYPPVAQILFFLITRVDASVVGMKLAWVAFEGLAAWALVHLLDARGLPRERLLIYAWSPLAVSEIAGSGHLDAAMIAFVPLAILAGTRGRDGLAGLLLGAATMVKFFPLVIFPALWRRGDWRLPAGVVAVVAAGYLLYSGAGAKVLGFLSGYSDEEGLRSGIGFWYAQLVQRTTGLAIPPTLYVAIMALTLGVAAFVIFSSNNRDKSVTGALSLATVGMVGLSPSHPWYFLWLAPFLCVSPRASVLWLIVVAPLLYWPNATGAPWNRDVLYGGFTLLALASLARQRVRLSKENGEPSCR